MSCTANVEISVGTWTQRIDGAFGCRHHGWKRELSRPQWAQGQGQRQWQGQGQRPPWWFGESERKFRQSERPLWKFLQLVTLRLTPGTPLNRSCPGVGWFPLTQGMSQIPVRTPDIRRWPAFDCAGLRRFSIQQAGALCEQGFC